MSAVAEDLQIVEAVFSVCAPAELVPSMMTAVDSVSGAMFAGEFQEYITGSRRPQFPSLLRESPVCVALVDCDTDAEAALETMEKLQQLLPGKMRLVGMSSSMDAGFLLRAMRAGCNEFLRKPLDAEELTRALRRFQASSAVEAAGAAQAGKAIAFMGTKGGVGTTTLAVHTAIHLVRTHKKRVLLIDQRQQLGHVALYLGIKQAKYHFSELLRNVDRLDSALLDGLVTRHSAGLDVIASPDMCSPRYEPKTEDAVAVISFLRQRYDFVLVDTEPECTSWLSSLMSCCDQAALICTPDVAALRDLARHIEYLSLTDGFAEKLRVLVNRAGSDPAVARDDIERAIRFPVAAEIPNNYVELVKSINAGEPIAPQSRGAFTQAMAKWTLSLARTADADFHATPVKKKFSLFGR